MEPGDRGGGASDPGRAVGHWESLAAGPGIARRAQALLAQYPDSELAAKASAGSAVSPGAFTAKDVFDELSSEMVKGMKAD